MSERPPVQTKFSFGEEGEAKIEIPEVEKPIFEIGDKVIFNPEYPHMKGVFEVSEYLLDWGEPLYIVKLGNLHSCCTKEALIKVE